MLSLSNAFSEEEIHDFAKRIVNYWIMKSLILWAEPKPRWFGHQFAL